MLAAVWVTWTSLHQDFHKKCPINTTGYRNQSLSDSRMDSSRITIKGFCEHIGGMSRPSPCIRPPCFPTPLIKNKTSPYLTREASDSMPVSCGAGYANSERVFWANFTRKRLKNKAKSPPPLPRCKSSTLLVQNLQYRTKLVKFTISAWPLIIDLVWQVNRIWNPS